MDQWGLSKRQFKANANMIKNPYANTGNTGNASSVPGSGKSPGKGHGNPLQYSCLENPMARAAWWVTVHGVTKVRHYWAHIHNSRSWPVPNLKISMREREREKGKLRLDQYFSSFLREFSLILITSLSSVDRKAFGIVISNINFIFMSNYHSISSHHTGQKQCTCS